MDFRQLKSAAKALSAIDRSRLLAELAGSLSQNSWPQSSPPVSAPQMAKTEEIEACSAPDWTNARALPPWVSPQWRSPERWRRLYESRLAGEQLLRLESFLTEAGALSLLDKVKALPFTRHDNPYLIGHYHQLTEKQSDELVPEFVNGLIHQLLGTLLDQTLPTRLFLRAFQLNVDDQIAEHVDGMHYAATFSLGLCPDWRASNGGAIAFGERQGEIFSVNQRWLPHLGDLLVFVTSASLLHRVEPVAAGKRLTLTGQYVTSKYPG